MAADPVTSRTVDDLMVDDAHFDFDDDPFADPKPARQTEREKRDDKPTLSPRKRKAADDGAFGNNINEEIKITKQRAKIPKLDAERLCSQPGIPKIRELLRSGQLKKKLRLKGKGHEFSDAARLLNYYQMWLDNLYPRAKFADALQLVEKSGHNKKMQVMRKAWIDEGKPGYVRKQDVDQAVDAQGEDRPSAEPQAQDDDTRPRIVEEDEDPASMFFGNNNAGDDAADADGPDDDELDALLAQDIDKAANVQKEQTADVESEGEDELDALLAERDTRRKPLRLVEEEDQADLDALLNDQDSFSMQQRTRTKSTKSTDTELAPAPTQGEEDDLDFLLNEDHQTQSPKSPQPAVTADKFDDGFDSEDLDGLDALLSNNASAKKAPEPELPQLNSAATSMSSTASKPVNNSATPCSEEVPELDNVISSSPIPNVQTDELDELMDEHDAKVNRRQVQTPKNTGDDTQLIEQFISSSPVPNEESQ